MIASGTIFVTGATGALGPALVDELLSAEHRVVALVRPGIRPSLDHRLHLVEGDVTNTLITSDSVDFSKIEVVVHAAADTRFRAPRDEQERINVYGTANILALARRCPNLRRFVFVSTACVAGTRTGSIGEAISTSMPEFVNFYEATKWHAEQLVHASGVPHCIVRLSTAIGGEGDGHVGRFGAIHYALRWMHRGLIPMLPGTEQTPVDLISTDLAARSIARCATMGGNAPEVLHIAAGERAVPLGELLDFLVEEFSARSLPWRQRQLSRPLVVDRTTFELFQQSVRQSGDVLFRTVLDSTLGFLPGLLHPKIYQTHQAESLFGGASLPLADWRGLLHRVIDRSLSHTEACHA